MFESAEPLGSNNTLLNLLNVIIVLALIVVLIVLLIRFLGRRNQSLMSGRSIRTLGAMGLGPNKSIQVIELGSSLYLIGVGEDISILDKVTDPAEVALIIEAFEDQSSSQNNFLTPLISKVRAKLRGEVPSQEIELSETSSFYYNSCKAGHQYKKCWSNTQNRYEKQNRYRTSTTTCAIFISNLNIYVWYRVSMNRTHHNNTEDTDQQKGKFLFHFLLLILW